MTLPGPAAPCEAVGARGNSEVVKRELLGATAPGAWRSLSCAALEPAKESCEPPRGWGMSLTSLGMLA